MTATQEETPVLTMVEIRQRFDGEWVLLEDPYRDEYNRVAGGKLLFHSSDRDEVDEADMRLRPKHAACFYIGAMPKNFFLNF